MSALVPVTSALVALLVMDQCHRFPPTTGSTFESLFQETRLTGRVSLVGFFSVYRFMFQALHTENPSCISPVCFQQGL